jgi:chemotaxis protein MotB
VRKKKPEKEANHERWLVSYADFITLLFAFFTTLYAISTVDAQKMGKMVTSMRASFDSNLFAPGSRTMSLNPGAGNNPSNRDIVKSVDSHGLSSKDLTAERLGTGKREMLGGEDLGRLKQRLESALMPEILKGLVRAHLEGRGLIISLGEGGIFDSGSDEIRPEGKVLLETISQSLGAIGNQLRVEGHTDNVPIRTARFPSNWELSTSRATRMIAYMIENLGYRADLLSAAGYAEYRPAAANSTEDGRSRNRRVDIVVLNPTAAKEEPK